MKGFSKEDEALKRKSNEEFLGTLGKWHEAAKKNRQIQDWNWYLYDNYYRGNHYIQYNKRTNQIVTPPRPKGQVRLVINKIYSICRGIRNFATSYRPKWEVTANSTSEDVINNSRKSADTLDYYYDYLEIPKKTKGLSLYLEKYGLGFFQYGWDDEATGIDNLKGEVDVWTRDPFDVYMDPAGMETGDIQNCRFVDIAVSKPVQDIINNKHYQQFEKLESEDISGDTTRAASNFKQILIQNQYAPDFSSSDELKTKIVHETWYKKRVKDGTEVWIASWIEGKLLRNEKTEFNKYPIIPVSSDDNPNEIGGEGYVKNLIPIIKVLNRLESQIVEYNNLINRGRILADKGAGVSKITNETGEIIEYNAGSNVTEFHPGGLAPDIHQQIARLNNYLDEISGVTDAFKGKVPEGVKSGVALESLKAQTANNLQDLKDNLETALAKLGEGILEMIATKYVVARQIKATGKDGKAEYFKIKGQVGAEANEKLPEDTYVIGMQNQVKVIIGSGLAYTREGRITRLDKLLEQGVIDPQTYLEHLEFGDVEEIMQRRHTEQISEAAIANVSKGVVPGQMGAQGGQMPPQGAQGAPAGQPAEGDNWLKLADDENRAMMNGEDIPSTKGAPKEHTAVHIAYSQSDEAQGDDELLARLLDHIKGEEQMQGIGAPPGAAGTVAPIGGQNASRV